MKAIKTARDDMSHISAEQRSLRALRSKVPPVARYLVKLGDLVRVFREKERIWIEPVEVVTVEGKAVYVSNTTKVMKFNVSQIMPLKSNHVAEDEGIYKLFIYTEEQYHQQQVATAVYLTELLDGKDPRTKNEVIGTG